MDENVEMETRNTAMYSVPRFLSEWKKEGEWLADSIHSLAGKVVRLVTDDAQERKSSLSDVFNPKRHFILCRCGENTPKFENAAVSHSIGKSQPHVRNH